MPLKRATDTASRATGGIEPFIERTLAPRMDARFTAFNARIDTVSGRIDGLAQRLEDSMNVRERLIALEIKVSARNG